MSIRKNFSIFTFIACLFMPYTASALTKAKQFKLDNGLKVIYMGLHNLPIIKVNLSLRGGSIWELPDKTGVTSVTMDMLDQGTANRTALQIAKKLDFVGASARTFLPSVFLFLRMISTLAWAYFQMLFLTRLSPKKNWKESKRKPCQ